MRQLRRRFPDEPYRQRFGAIAERLRRTRASLTATAGAPVGGRYTDPSELIVELDEVPRRWSATGSAGSAWGEVQDFRWQVETFGFHLASLEVRQHATCTRRRSRRIRRRRSRFRAAGLTRGDRGRGPRDVPGDRRDAGAVRRPAQQDAMSSASRRSAADVLAVLELAGLAGSADSPAAATGGFAPAVPVLDVVPLFESADALEDCAAIIDAARWPTRSTAATCSPEAIARR